MYRIFPKREFCFTTSRRFVADPLGPGSFIELSANPFRGKNIDLVIGAESRVFIFGAAVAWPSRGFWPGSQAGQASPQTRISKSYELEYGVDSLEMHEDAIVRGQRVLIVDDVLATGGQNACCELVDHLGGELAGIAVLIELKGLGGREGL